MRTLVLAALAATTALAATPAMANETRVEARGGIAWGAGDSEAIAGVAAGYDFDLGDSGFAGAEISADKVLVDGSDVVFGLSARAGAKLGEGKLYGIGGYSAAEGPDAWHLGAGYQHKLGSSLYLKGEYRHFFTDFEDIDALVAGVGFTF